MIALVLGSVVSAGLWLAQSKVDVPRQVVPAAQPKDESPRQVALAARTIELAEEMLDSQFDALGLLAVLERRLEQDEGSLRNTLSYIEDRLVDFTHQVRRLRRERRDYAAESEEVARLEARLVVAHEQLDGVLKARRSLKEGLARVATKSASVIDALAEALLDGEGEREVETARVLQRRARDLRVLAEQVEGN